MSDRTYRERREARAQRLRDWAEKREKKAEDAFGAAERISGMIPPGQPILVGHHSEGRHRRDLDRIDRSMRKGIEHADKAKQMASKAANIEAQADRAIYDDDPDAIQRLEERIAELEAERARIKAYNASCRKGKRDPGLLDARQQATLVSVAEHSPYQLGDKGEFPRWGLSNLSGNINRYRKRLKTLRARQS